MKVTVRPDPSQNSATRPLPYHRLPSTHVPGDPRPAAMQAARDRIASHPAAPLVLTGREAAGVSALEVEPAFQRWRQAAGEHIESPSRATAKNLSRWCGDVVSRLTALAAYESLHDDATRALDVVKDITAALLDATTTDTSASVLADAGVDRVSAWLGETASSQAAAAPAPGPPPATDDAATQGPSDGQRRRSAVGDLLGLDIDDLCDENGEYSPEIVIGAMHGQYPQLLELLLELTQPLAKNGLQMDRALDAAHHLQLSDGPLRLWAAQQAKQHIVDAYRKNPVRTAEVMRELRNRTDNSAANRQRLKRNRQQLNLATTRTVRAELSLERYRLIVEGQLRPWGWTLARLVGGYDDAKMPELSGIRERLVKADTPGTRAVADTILPIARNAAAHEDYQYDDRRHLLRVGSDTITLEELDETCIQIVALVSGFELGFGAARADTVELRRDMDDSDPAAPATELLRRRSMEHFATNGLKPLRGERSGTTFTVTIDSLAPEQINPMLQAVLWSSRIQPDIDTFVVQLPDRSAPIVEVDRSVLDRTYPLWVRCRHWFDGMPTGLFAGINAAARLAIETGPVAVQAAVWIGANDLVHALNELWEPWWPRHVSAFADLAHRAYTVEHASRIALDVTGNTGAGKLHQVIHRAADLCAAARREDLAAVRTVERRLRKLQEPLALVPILPTWSSWTPPVADD